MTAFLKTWLPRLELARAWADWRTVASNRTRLHLWALDVPAYALTKRGHSFPLKYKALEHRTSQGIKNFHRGQLTLGGLLGLFNSESYSICYQDWQWLSKSNNSRIGKESLSFCARLPNLSQQRPFAALAPCDFFQFARINRSLQFNSGHLPDIKKIVIQQGASRLRHQSGSKHRRTTQSQIQQSTRFFCDPYINTASGFAAHILPGICARPSRLHQLRERLMYYEDLAELTDNIGEHQLDG